jgi:hypothetical protein
MGEDFRAVEGTTPSPLQLGRIGRHRSIHSACEPGLGLRSFAPIAATGEDCESAPPQIAFAAGELPDAKHAARNFSPARDSPQSAASARLILTGRANASECDFSFRQRPSAWPAASPSPVMPRIDRYCRCASTRPRKPWSLGSFVRYIHMPRDSVTRLGSLLTSLGLEFSASYGQ